MKHTLLPILALLLAAQTFVACGDTADTTNTDTDNADTAQTEAETEKPMWIDNLPAELDFNGEKIVVNTRYDGSDTDLTYIEVGPADEIGEVLNDGFYDRNRAIEARLGVKIEIFKGHGWETYGDEINRIRASVSAGDNAWQIISGWGASITPLALENCFLDLLSQEYLDTAQPWWNADAVEGMQIGGGLYFLSGDINVLSTLGGAFVLYMNDRIAGQYDIGDLSAAVLDGTWTIDKLAETVKVAVADTNGDSVMDAADQWGLVTSLHNPADMFYTASDIHQITLKDGLPSFVSAEEKVTALYDKIYPFFYGGEAAGSYLTDNAEGMFAAGQALMSCTTLNAALAGFRDMEDDYTILPAPKFDEAQKNYYTYASNAVQLFGIPSDNPNPDAAAAVMEAMAAYNYNSLTDLFFEVCLQDKYARNEASVEMLDIIQNGTCLDCEYLYRDILGNTCYVMRNILLDPTVGVASYYAANEKSIEGVIEATVAALSALEG